MEYARPGDNIVIWKLDRLGRSTIKLIELIEELKNQGVNLKSLSESIDTNTATGNLFFQFMCVLAEHERNIPESEQKQAWNQPVPGVEPEGGRVKLALP